MINIYKFKLISHRGLLNGPSSKMENNISNIIDNIKKYPFLINELDIWINSDSIYVGHNCPNYSIDKKLLFENSRNLILHIKGINSFSVESLQLIQEIIKKCHCFSHQDDDFTLTNKGWIWSHPSKGFIENTICVLPETINSLDLAVKIFNFEKLHGVCTDYPLKVLNLMKLI